MRKDKFIILLQVLRDESPLHTQRESPLRQQTNLREENMCGQNGQKYKESGVVLLLLNPPLYAG